MKWLQGLGLLKEPATTTEQAGPSSTEPAAPPLTETPVGSEIPPAALPETVPVPVSSDGREGDLADPALESAAPLELTAVIANLGELTVQQQALRQLFENRLRSDEVQAKALERLHDELQQYKTNFVRQSLTPVLKEVIFCHDFVVQQAERVGQPEASAETAQRALDAVRQMLVDLLFKFDVEPYRNEPGAGGSFDPRTQQCLKTLPTEQPDLDKRIAQQGACGFRTEETILRRELVTVYKYSGEPRPAAGN